MLSAESASSVSGSDNNIPNVLGSNCKSSRLRLYKFF